MERTKDVALCSRLGALLGAWLGAPALAFAFLCFLMLSTAKCDDQSGGNVDIMRPIVVVNNSNADVWVGVSSDNVTVIKVQQKKKLDQMRYSKLPYDMITELTSAAGPALAQDLPEIEEVKAADSQKVLEVGSMMNKSGDNCPYFNEAMASLRTKLAGNEAVTGSYILVDRTSAESKREEKAATQTAGGDGNEFDDPAQRTPSQTKKVVYNPKDIYLLSAEFFVMDDGGGKARKITFQLHTTVSHPQSGEIKIDRMFTKIYHWDMDRKEFVPES